MIWYKAKRFPVKEWLNELSLNYKLSNFVSIKIKLIELYSHSPKSNASNFIIFLLLSRDNSSY